MFSQLHRLQDLTGDGLMVGLVGQFSENPFQGRLLHEGAEVLDGVVGGAWAVDTDGDEVVAPPDLVVMRPMELTI